MKIWQLPAAEPERSHGLKYRLVFISSAQALANHHERDDESNLEDIKVLKKMVIIVQDESGRLQVPWDKIDVKLPWAA